MIERSLNAFGLVMFGVVMTLLVIVFAVTPIVCGLGPPIRLPEVATAEVIRGTETDLEIWITQDRSVFVSPNLVQRAELSRVLRGLDRNRHVLISADGRVSWGDIEDVLATVRNAGFARTSLITYRGPRELR